MLLHAYRSRFRMPHWCGLAESPYAGVGQRSEHHSDIAQWVEHQPKVLRVTGSNPVIPTDLATGLS